jgi:hypothetical protein
MHSSADFSILPLTLRSHIQIKFPEEDAYFMGGDGLPKKIGREDGTDMLTSIQSFGFDDFYLRAQWQRRNQPADFSAE